MPLELSDTKLEDLISIPLPPALSLNRLEATLVASVSSIGMQSNSESDMNK